jgi:HD-GYP domain-containing protein (c-di-GMP phosphodiesterase class II)
MNLLLNFSTAELRDVLTFPLESKLNVKITSVSTDEEALALVVAQQFDYVVIEEREGSLKKFVEKNKQKPIAAKFVICVKTPGTKPDTEGLTVLGVVDTPNYIDGLMELISKDQAAKGNKNPETQEGDDGKYCRIRTSLLMKLSPLEVGVYIRLAADHYVKLFTAGDTFGAEDLKKYTEKKQIFHLYVPKENASALIGKLNEELKKLLANPNLKMPQAQEALEESVDVMQNLIGQLGMTEEVQEVVKNNIDTTMKAMGDFPELSNILKDLKANPGTYISSHSLFLAHVSCALAVAVDWYSETTFQKLTMAAFLHDTTMKDNELCRVKNLEEFEKKYKGKFNSKQIQEYKSHPERAAVLVAQFKEVAAEVDKIILQHHEHPYGTGFPGALTGNYISPLGSLFIVAHDLVDHIFDNDGKANMEDFLLEQEKKYSAGNFKKIAKAIAQMVF